MKKPLQSKTDQRKTSQSVRKMRSGQLSSTALASSTFTNPHSLSLSSIENNPAPRVEVETDIPKNDWATIEPFLNFLPKALLGASVVSVTTLITLLLLSCNRGASVAVATGTGVLTFFGLCHYKSAQVHAQINRDKKETVERFELTNLIRA